MSDSFLDDFEQFETDLFSGKFDHLVGVITKKPEKKAKEKKAVVQLLAQPAAAPKVILPDPVGFFSQELEITCTCGAVQHFITSEKKVKMQYKNGRSFLMELSKETKDLVLPEEKMISLLKVFGCNQCRGE